MPKGSSSPPQSPSGSQIAQEQSQANVKTAVANSYLNNVNQSTPYGSLTYTPDYGKGTVLDGYGVPQWTATQTLNPAGQRLQDTQMSITQGTADLANSYVGRIADATSQPYSYSGLPNAPTYDSAYVQKATDDIIARNQPQMDRDRAALEQRLADQGIGLQDPAYRTAMDQYSRSVNDFRLGAQTQGQSMASNQYNLEANTRDRAIQEMTNLRSQPINEVAALLGTGAGVKDPTFVNTPQTQIAPTDVVGAYNTSNQAQMAAYQAAQQQNAATTGGLFGLGGSVLGAGLKYGLPLLAAGSDIRMKENIRHIGHTNDGQRLYSFNYIGDPRFQIGLMAQEVEKVHPEAVLEIDGLKYVDYGKALANV